MVKNVLTIATGKKLYVDLAVNLARSFWYWNSDTNIDFYLVTDVEELLPEDIKAYTKIIKVKKDELGKGFTPKLFLDKLAPAGQTLFIDSDCLVYGNLNIVFEKFKGHNVSVIGTMVSNIEWFGDIEKICKKFDIPHLPKFNGGVYYLENGENAAKVYQKARDLEQQYDEIGFVRLRGRPNDEVLMALSMQLMGEQPIEEDGSVMAEFVNFKSGVKSDLLNGKAELYNTPGHKEYNQLWPLRIAKPLIVHYLGNYNQLHPYITEAKTLDLLAKGKNKSTAKILAELGVAVPYKLKEFTRNTFRPAYRLLFGFRQIEKSERIID
jgi:hypothetical protein